MTTTIENQTIIGYAPELISSEKYIANLTDLITRSIASDPTLVIHSAHELAHRYHHSIIALIDDRLIANTSIYPTHMAPLDTLTDPVWNPIHIGECGSTVIDLEKRYHWLWTNLTKKAIEQLSHSYQALIAATINPSMEHIRKRLWYEEVPFPKEYFEEWKQFLAPRLPGGIKEFEQRAKCLMRFEGNMELREYILQILQNQTQNPELPTSLPLFL